MEVLITKKNIVLDATLLSSLMSCERLTDYRFNHNLVPITGKGNPLESGSLVHKILQTFYKCQMNGIARQDAIGTSLIAGTEYYKNECTNVPLENEKDKQGKLKKVGYNWIMKTMEEYFDFYRGDSWTPLECEKVLGEVFYEDDECRILYKAKLDLLVDTNNGFMPIDHKTMKQKRDTLSLNNQFMGQCILTKTQNVCINKIGFQTSLKSEEKFLRPILSYSKARLAEQISTVSYYGQYLAQLHEQNYWPPRYSHCDKFNGCIMKGICESDPSMREEELKLHFMVGDSWDISDDED